MNVNSAASTRDPLVSIIVPIYNINSYLEKCIESILAQTYKNIEVILVDDGSTDGSSELCDEWSSRDHRLEVIHKPNGGLSSARNQGIEKSSGDYLMFIDGDDYIDPSMTDVLLERARDTKADMVIGGFLWVKESGSVIRAEQFSDTLMGQKQFWKSLYPHRGFSGNAGSGFFVVAWNKLYSRKLFVDERYDVGRLHEDEFILHRLIDQCEYIATVCGCYYNYVQRPGSITHREKPSAILDAAQALMNRSVYLSNIGMEFESLSCCVDVATTLCRIPTRLVDLELQARRNEIERSLLAHLNEGDVTLLGIKSRLKLFIYRRAPLIYHMLINYKRMIHRF